MTAMGAVERRLNISLIWCPVHLVGLGIGSMYSLEAMAMAWVCTNCVIAILYTRQMRALLNATLRQLYGPSAKSLVVVAATAGVQTAALAWMRAEAMPKVVILFVAAAVGFGVWLVCVRSLRHPVYEELIRVAHRLGVPWPAARAAGA
jgi:hypothetical protein